ncbi:hypothetical protein [Mesorhizobium sp. M1396]|uniref:hypothetical protein n=1 Tax=Mesorhizobium sp. M1396 TaxID=2957095 RepID=UPI0033371EC4
MEDSASLAKLSCPYVDFEPCPAGLAKAGIGDAGALAGLVRFGLPLETAGWRLHRGHHAGESR